MSNRKQSVVLDGQNSSWSNGHAGGPQGSILGPLLFLIYITDLANDLSSADDTSLFSVVHDVNASARGLNVTSKRLISFDPDQSKPARKIPLVVK